MTAVIVTVGAASIGSWLGGRSLSDLLPIVTALMSFAILFLRTYSFLAHINKTIETQSLIIQNDRDEIDRLLSNILPGSIIDRLKSGECPIADYFETTAVLFTDIVGFTEWSSQRSPAEVVTNLNEIFTKLDQLVAEYQLEKIKTIGDAYMVVGGAPNHQPHAPESMAHLALAIQNWIQTQTYGTPYHCQLRIGIHIGPIVAGVIGNHKFAYDLWGDTVNVASRMESSGLPGKIHCSEAVYERLKNSFQFEKRSPVTIKGKGVMQTYFLLDSNGEE